MTDPKYHPVIDARIEAVARNVLDCGFKVHSALGPGLLESAYETCLAYEISRLGLNVQRQQALPIFYEGINLEAGYRIDLLVE